MGIFGVLRRSSLGRFVDLDIVGLGGGDAKDEDDDEEPLASSSLLSSSTEAVGDCRCLLLEGDALSKEEGRKKLSSRDWPTKDDDDDDEILDPFRLPRPSLLRDLASSLLRYSLRSLLAFGHCSMTQRGIQTLRGVSGTTCAFRGLLLLGERNNSCPASSSSCDGLIRGVSMREDLAARTKGATSYKIRTSTSSPVLSCCFSPWTERIAGPAVSTLGVSFPTLPVAALSAAEEALATGLMAVKKRSICCVERLLVLPGDKVVFLATYPTLLLCVFPRMSTWSSTIPPIFWLAS